MRFLRAPVILLLLLVWIRWGAGAADAPLKICLLSASAEYKSDESLADLQTFLESHYRIQCSRAFGKDKGQGLPGIEALHGADLVIVYTRRVTLPPAQLERLRKYLASGKPVLGIRTASHGFASLPEFDREILGGGYTGHYTNGQAHVELVPGRIAHPVLAGVKPFESRKIYKNPNLAPDVLILLEASFAGVREPVAWVRDNASRRLFYTSLGVQEDFKNQNFQRLLVNAIFWTTSRDEQIFRQPAADAR
jgi:type 1 glutamine amidotransferase